MLRILTTTLLLAMAIASFAQKPIVEIIKFDKLEQHIAQEKGKQQIINFWATWCAPCVKEIPYFEKINNERPEVEVLLVSLNFSDEIDKVHKFIETKSIKSKVVLLDEVDYNLWIDKIDKSWSGAIPATLFVDKQNKRYLKEGELTFKEINDFINQKK